MHKIKYAIIGVLAVSLLACGVFHKKVERLISKASIEFSVLTYAHAENSKWEGRTWNAVGDSITENNIYTKLVSASLGLKYNNYGLSSSTVAINNSYLKNQSICERVKNCKDADVWTIFGGVNDWLYKTPLGEKTDTPDQTGTFYGALKNICEEILGRPNKPTLFLFTPLQSNRNGENEENVSMLQYRQAIIDVGEIYHVKVIDLYNNGGITDSNLNKLTKDGIHPTLDGTEIYTKEIIKGMLN